MESYNRHDASIRQYSYSNGSTIRQSVISGDIHTERMFRNSDQDSKHLPYSNGKRRRQSDILLTGRLHDHTGRYTDSIRRFGQLYIYMVTKYEPEQHQCI